MTCFKVCIIVLLSSVFPAKSWCQGFLKADGKRIVNGSGENVIIRGIGLGGWMIQEGYMLHINGDGQQYRIRQRIADFLTPEQTRQFYDAWLSNQTTKADIDSLHAWGFNTVRLPMHYQLYTLTHRTGACCRAKYLADQGI
jgi:endoglucanase